LVTSIPDISLLTGLQKKILFFIVEDCIYRGQLISGCITNEALREITKTTANTVKTAVQRLIKKGFIKRNPDKNGKRGKGGFSSFIITKDVRDGVIIEKRAPRISNQLVTQLVTPNSNQLVTNKESNREPNTLSSSLNIKNTTTELSKEWQDINIEPLKEIGFTENRLWKLKNHGIDRKALQASIDHFAFDLKHNNKAASIKKTPIEFFMGIMLHDGYYTPPANYESPQEKARRLYIEHEEAKSKETAAMIERLLNVEFEKWYEGLSDEQKNEILPDSLRHAKERKFGREYLKNHFKENIWQDSFQKLEANGYNLALSVS
jgi:predicted transcriptional regulator